MSPVYALFIIRRLSTKCLKFGVPVILVKFIQACFFVFYLYVGMVYTGIVVLLPLGIFYHLYRLFHLLSFNGATAAILALATVGGLVYVLVQIQDIVQIILISGIRLAELGLGQLRELGALAQSIRAAMIESAPNKSSSATLNRNS